MRQSSFAVACLALILLPPTVRRAEAFYIEDRWTQTATNGFNVGSFGSAITLTWSIAPDGTNIPGNPSGTLDSNLIDFFDTRIGAGPGGADLTQRPWFTYLEQSYARIGDLSGLTFVYEANDDGRSFSEFNARGVLGVRGDLRLGGKSYGAGSSTLASNYFPNYGEMMVNTDKGAQLGNSSGNYLRLRNVFMHETLHGLGIHHILSNNAAFLLEPSLQTAFDGPQLDDLLALHRLYGDAYEKEGGNDTFFDATPLGMLSPTQPLTIGTLGGSTSIASSDMDFVSISSNTNADYFSFSIDQPLEVNLLLTPRGTTYNAAPQTTPATPQTPFNTLTRNDLAMSLFDTDGVSLLSSAASNPAGESEEIVQQLSPGTYYVQVTGAQDDVQLYGLNLVASVPLSELPGDFNLDGQVDAADYVVWRSGMGTIYTLDDYNLWRDHFGQTTSGGSASLTRAGVPEPPASALVLSAMLLLGIGRKAIRRLHELPYRLPA